jgi:hypothetical protein
MNNFWNKLRYFAINRFHISTPSVDRSHYEGIYSDEFKTLSNWVVVNPDTIESSRSNGALFSIKQIQPKGYVYPCIISRATITGGSVLITAKLNDSDEVFYHFSLRAKGKELGYKIVGDRIYVINPVKPKSFKLYKPTEEHTFEIDVNPDNDMVYWRVDGAAIYELHYPSHTHKRLMVAMPTIRTKMSTKKLPISFRLKCVDFFMYTPNKPQKQQ